MSQVALQRYNVYVSSLDFASRRPHAAMTELYMWRSANIPVKRSGGEAACIGIMAQDLKRKKTQPM